MDQGLIVNTDNYIKLSYKGVLYPVETSIIFYLKRDKKKLSYLA